MRPATSSRVQPAKRTGFEDVINVLRIPETWLIAIVILCAYSAYWGTFRLTPYASDMFGLSVTIAAVIAVGKMWMKPIAALIAGFVSDHFGISRSLIVLFGTLSRQFRAVCGAARAGVADLADAGQRCHRVDRRVRHPREFISRCWRRAPSRSA